MNYLKSKNVVKMLAVLLTLSFVASMAAIPKTTADIHTYPFVDPIPNVVGVGQYTLINFGLLNYLGDSKSGWNVTLVITDPDGKVEKVDRMTWSTGTVGYGYTPTKAGNYTLQCTFKNVTYGTTNNNRQMHLSSESENVTLYVLEDWYAPYHPGHSMPTSYWTRPVDSQLREWYSIMGSWLRVPVDMYTHFQGDAPESAHILWNMPIGDRQGGLAGGATEMVGHETGDAYEGKFVNSLIVDGILFYNKYPASYVADMSNGGTAAGYTRALQTIVAVDLHTGKVLWEKRYTYSTDISTLTNAYGQTLQFLSVNNRAVFSYLWLGGTAATLYAIDPYTGANIYNMTNVPSGQIYFGPNGELLKYTWDNTNSRLRQWNSTAAAMGTTDPMSGTAYGWSSKVDGRIINAGTYGYDRNIPVSIGTRNLGAPSYVIPEDKAVWLQRTNNFVGLTGVSLDYDSGGSVLYNNRTWNAPKEWQDMTVFTTPPGGMLLQSGWAAISPIDQIAVIWIKELRVHYAFSLETGKFLWETEPQIYADSWSDTVLLPYGIESNAYGPERAIADGKLISTSCGGIVYCYNVTNGEKIWEYKNTQKYAQEYYLTNEWWSVICFVADGKVYIGHMEHSAMEPKPRGAPFFALDIETGDLVWEIDGAFRQTRWGGRAIIGDSIIVTQDLYDQMIYAIGKGPSTMTMTTPNVAITAGTTALITGTVMDVSPGTQNDRAQLQFPQGVPVASDESQSEWMLHVYKQFAAPATFTGVEVSFYAWDGQSAESVPIGTTTTDVYGKYSLAWTPQQAGQYQIFAFFDGSASYYASEAKADIYVSAAPPEPEPVETPPYGLYIALAAIAIIVAIAIVGILLFMKINKR